MSDPLEPKPTRQRSQHDLPPRTIAMIFGVMVVGIIIGMLLVLPHYGPRKPRRRSALGHVVPTSLIGRETNGMVWVPGGLFMMGATDGKPDEAPVHEATVGPLWMDKTEVTNEQFAKFVEVTGYLTVAEQRTNQSTWRHPDGPTSDITGKEISPVVWVAWSDAVAFARWAGKRLPTEAEWEHAARGGLHQQRYSWGNEKPGEGTPRGNFGGAGTNHITAPMSAGSFPPNGYALLDMEGNVAEWCADWYSAAYYASSPKLNPKGPGDPPTPAERVVRGGSFQIADRASEALRVSARGHEHPDISRRDLGFRCVKDGF